MGNGKKVVLFSVWDPGDQNDPKSVQDDQRVKLLHQGEGVRIGRFGALRFARSANECGPTLSRM